MPDSHLDPGAGIPDNDQTWYDLYVWLLSLVETWVNNTQLAHWYGQRRDVSEDVTQDAIFRIYSYHQRSLQGTVQSIRSLKAFSTTVARNLLRDKIQRERRLVRLKVSYDYDSHSTVLEGLDSMEEIAHIIATFPPKQKAALLIDLANRGDFDDSSFERALRERGLRLRDYQQPPPSDPRERRQYTTLLSLARKRLRSVLSQS